VVPLAKIPTTSTHDEEPIYLTFALYHILWGSTLITLNPPRPGHASFIMLQRSPSNLGQDELSRYPPF
jgi:hypothetical protein